MPGSFPARCRGDAALAATATIFLCLLASGCSRDSGEVASESPASTAPGADEMLIDSPAPSSHSTQDSAADADPADADPPGADPGGVDRASAVPEGSADPAAPPPSLAFAEQPERPRDDATPEQLVASLAQIDAEIQRVSRQGERDITRQELIAQLKEVAGAKLELAEQLLESPQASASSQRLGQRAKLEALSHQAALGDVRAAETLEAYAGELAVGDDRRVAADSRLVLVGFALERLHAGRPAATDEILRLTAQLAEDRELLDISGLMAMQHAREVLREYGDDESARQVRQAIVTAFGNHPDGQLAAMAGELAGTERFDSTERLRRQLDEGQPLAAAQWSQRAEELAHQGADLPAFQYLASQALHFEAIGRDDLAEATYEVLQQHFAAADSPAVAAEAGQAMAAYQARQEAIGQTVHFDQSDLYGAPIDWNGYRGRVVLMPFWLSSYPPSLGIFPELERLQRAYGNAQVRIVGVNLDDSAEAAREVLEQVPMSWPSLRSTTSGARGAQNPLARQLGVVSLPFVAVIDPEGRVAALSLNGSGIAEAVERLLGPPADAKLPADADRQREGGQAEELR